MPNRCTWKTTHVLTEIYLLSKAQATANDHIVVAAEAVRLTPSHRKHARAEDAELEHQILKLFWPGPVHFGTAHAMCLLPMLGPHLGAALRAAGAQLLGV